MIREKLTPVLNQNGLLEGYSFWCPGCGFLHWFQVPRWVFNNDLERPTFTPSLLNWNEQMRCHLFLCDGHLQFLGDCTHHLAGQTVPLAPMPEDDEDSELEQGEA